MTTSHIYDDTLCACHVTMALAKTDVMSLVDDKLSAPEPADKFARMAWLRALKMTAPIASQPARILPTVIDDLAEVYGEAPALLSDHQCLTFRGLADLSNRYSRWALHQGVSKGDVVCLLLPNRPEYMAIWLGVTRIGGTVSLLNTHLTGAALAHCINVVGARHVIVAAELLESLENARPHFARDPKTWVHGVSRPGFPRIDLEAEPYAGAAPKGANLLQSVSIEDVALNIYTSGTTGLPKAANVSHHRLMQWSYWFAGMMDVGPGDRMYNCLPMYHSVGGVVAIGAVLVNGGSVVIRETFSARQFWDDIAKWDCTLFQYIGELCRYLVNSEPHRQERNHRIRLCCGNGLRPDIWNNFKNRFGIPHILEFYAATEGTFSLYNAEGKIGAIGRVPPFLTHRFPIALVKFDFEKNEPLRNSEGFCILCDADEAGEAIGRISGENPGGNTRFEGYTNRQESERKVLRNVFDNADAWFRTGDLMRKDKRGYFYFVDRVGDTFRWKGENVSTTEIAEVMMGFAGIAEANVFGVTIPATDGRAGMATVVARGGLDLIELRNHLIDHLPAYARPLFLRIQSKLDVTPTFKHKKNSLAYSGYDPSQTSDAIYFNDNVSGSFVRLDSEIYNRLQNGQIRV